MEDRIAETLARLKSRLQELLKDSLVNLVLFGSRARGDYEESSDVSEQEFNRLRERERRIAQDILEEGVAL